MVRIADVEESLDFYCGKLGMVETRRIENEDGRFTLIFLAAPGDVETARAPACAVPADRSRAPTP